MLKYLYADAFSVLVLYADPVLLCNDLGTVRETAQTLPSASDPPRSGAVIESSGHHSMSIKEAVRIALSNNFMGLVCSSRLLVSLSTSLFPLFFSCNPSISILSFLLLRGS